MTRTLLVFRLGVDSGAAVRIPVEYESASQRMDLIMHLESTLGMTFVYEEEQT